MSQSSNQSVQTISQPVAGRLSVGAVPASIHNSPGSLFTGKSLMKIKRLGLIFIQLPAVDVSSMDSCLLISTIPVIPCADDVLILKVRRENGSSELAETIGNRAQKFFIMNKKNIVNASIYLKNTPCTIIYLIKPCHLQLHLHLAQQVQATVKQ